MTKLLMLSGYGATQLAQGKRNAFFNTLSILRTHFDRIDILAPGGKWWFTSAQTKQVFENVFVYTSPWPLWLQWWWASRKGLTLHKENQYNVITAHEYPPFYNGISAYLLWRNIHVPYMIEIMHIEGLPRTMHLKDRFYQWLSRFVLPRTTKSAHTVRVINQKQVPEFLQSIGIPKNKLQYIPAFYIDFQTFKPQPNIEKKYDAIFVGRLTANKGVDLLLDAWKNIDGKLLVVGDGPKRHYIEQHKTSNIELHGYAKDSVEIAQLINQSKMLIMPSYSEGGPRVTLEAMACAVPVLTTKVGIMADIIKDGENGVFIDWDKIDIVKKAKKLLQNSDKALQIGEEGQRTVQKFEQKEAIKNYAQELKK